MDLVCNIPDELYKKWETSRFTLEEAVQFVDCVMKGTPLSEAEPCEDVVSREVVKKLYCNICMDKNVCYRSKEKCEELGLFDKLPSVAPKQRLCKDCKFFEYDRLAMVDGIPLVMVHSICSKWGNGCETNENGYCFLFEPKTKGGT